MKEKPFYFPFNDYVKLFEHMTGCRIKPEKDLIEKRLERFLKKYNIQPDNIFLAEKLIKSDSECFNSFIDIFIPVESFFFREEDYLNLAITIAQKEKLKDILVAPCANGETVYSLKIMAMEKKIENLTLTGIDISKTAIEKAATGIYNKHSVKNIPLKIINKYFKIKEGKYKIKDTIKSRIKFQAGNLANLSTSGKYDIILCRNFLMYLKEETIELILKNLCNMLKRKGFLILGKSELPFIKHSPGFIKESYNNLLYFRKLSWQNC